LASEVLNTLHSATGCQRFVLGGICSAADLGWKVALQDKRVIGLMLLDPLARRSAPGFRLGQLQILLRRGPLAWIDIARRRMSARTPLQRPTDSDLRDWPAPGDEAPQLSSLVRRGVEVLALYTGGAANYMTHRRQFDAGFGSAARDPRVSFEHWKQCDHLFYRVEDRQRLLNRVTSWFQDRIVVKA
jgi:hypothetical protein